MPDNHIEDTLAGIDYGGLQVLSPDSCDGMIQEWLKTLEGHDKNRRESRSSTTEQAIECLFRVISLGATECLTFARGMNFEFVK
jgi:hypothetical protein